AFLAALAALQLFGLALQFHYGYRPFVRPPRRVAFSWDMFSTPIVRCDVRWDPPLRVGERTVRSLSDTGWVLEWDAVYGSEAAYRAGARGGCASAAGPTVAHLRCFAVDGGTSSDDVVCP